MFPFFVMPELKGYNKFNLFQICYFLKSIGNQRKIADILFSKKKCINDGLFELNNKHFNKKRQGFLESFHIKKKNHNDGNSYPELASLLYNRNVSSDFSRVRFSFTILSILLCTVNCSVLQHMKPQTPHFL